MPSTNASSVVVHERRDDARWPMVCAGTALVGSCYGLARFAYGLFAPELMTEFSISSTVSGVIAAGSYVGYCVAIVASLLLTPRWGPQRVGVFAGAVATAGTATVAVAPTTVVLAAGVLLAGSSTGLASPPMAAAVARWVDKGAQDRAQTIVNAGTGLGVLISGPVALVFLDDWRLAWGGFAVLAAAVTAWVAVTVPSGRELESTSPRDRRERPTAPGRARGAPSARERRLTQGSARLIAASFILGLSSIAVWGFGRELIVTEADAGAVFSAGVWTVVGAAGIAGAFGGDLVQRAGSSFSWIVLMLTLGVSTAIFAIAPSVAVAVLVAAALFGASYIGLTGLVLLWSTRLYPGRAALGVGLSFFMVAAGQASGAPAVGRLIESFGPTPVFYGWAALSLLGAAFMPTDQPTTSPGVLNEKRLQLPSPE